MKLTDERDIFKAKKKSQNSRVVAGFKDLVEVKFFHSVN